MQLTPSPDVTASGRHSTGRREARRPGAGRRGTGALARLDRPAAAGLIALAGWLAFVLARLVGWAHGQLSLFIESGTHYSHPAQMFPRIAHVLGKGYDGQFYYRFALDPFDWQRTASGISIDHPYRYTRIGYSVVAWLLSGGGHGRVLPLVLVAVNLVSVAAMASLGAVFARDGGRHALWGLLFAGYFGLVISIGRDTSEPLADACLLAGLLACRRRRYLLAAVAVSYAVFTNEPVLVFPVVLALVRLWQLGRRQVRPGRVDLVWLLPALLYLLLQVIQRLAVQGTPGGVADASANLTWPFTALVAGLDRDVHRMSWTHLGLYDYNLAEFLVLAVFVVAGLAVLRSTAAPAVERAAFAGFAAIEIVAASSQFWYSVFGDGRTYVDAYLMAVVLLLATPPRILTRRRLSGLAAVAAAGLILVARRRILFE